MKKKLSLMQSVLWIFFSAICINLLAYGGIQSYRYWKAQKSIDYQVPITTIIQTGPQKEALKTSYLSQLLDLSADNPTLTSTFDLKEGQQKLITSPVIKSAEIKIYEPGVLYIDYTTRQPLVLLGDFENIALDKERVPFPLMPFFTPKKLPEVYLGMDEDILWDTPLRGEKIDLVFHILDALQGSITTNLFHIKRIDVSNAFEKSYGRQEIVIIAEDEIYEPYGKSEMSTIFPRTLRLSTKKYAEEFKNYLKLREDLLEKERCLCRDSPQAFQVAPMKVIDLRIEQLAFIEEVP